MRNASDALPDDIAGLFRLLDEHPLLEGAARAVHRADGMTELRDGYGAVKAWLPTEDFEAISRWRERPTYEE